MRPKSIALFEGLSLLSVALAAFLVVATLGGTIPGSGARSAAGSAAVASAVIAIVVTLVLILLASRKRSNVAKWILVALVAVGVAMALPRLAFVTMGGALAAADIGSVVLQVIALVFLFTPEARAWFAGRGTAA